MNDAIETAKLKLGKAKNVLVLTGAGISAESGVPTFRGTNGLWNNMSAEEVASIDTLNANPEMAWRWYDEMRGVIAANKPNPAHLALAQMEKKYRNFALATQNIDGYHTDAGSADVYELHGNFWKLHCMKCGAAQPNRAVPIGEIPPHCKCGGILRPDIVLFGEALPERAFKYSFAAAERCDVCIVIGTSCVVYPAALIPQIAKRNGAFLIEINPEKTALTPLADVSIHAPAAKTVPEFLA
jgi:NAD-dependent deacetylase